MGFASTDQEICKVYTCVAAEDSVTGIHFIQQELRKFVEDPDREASQRPSCVRALPPTAHLLLYHGPRRPCALNKRRSLGAVWDCGHQQRVA